MSSKLDKQLDYTDLYGVRVLVFVEKEAHTNQYYQVLLTPDMYKNMTATICKPTGKKEGRIEEQELKTSVEEYRLPDLPEAYQEGSF